MNFRHDLRSSYKNITYNKYYRLFQVKVSLLKVIRQKKKKKKLPSKTDKVWI